MAGKTATQTTKRGLKDVQKDLKRYSVTWITIHHARAYGSMPLLSWIHYDNSDFGQVRYVTGGLDGYVPEQGVFLAAFALSDRSYDDGSAQESGLFLGKYDIAGINFELGGN